MATTHHGNSTVWVSSTAARTGQLPVAVLGVSLRVRLAPPRRALAHPGGQRGAGRRRIRRGHPGGRPGAEPPGVHSARPSVVDPTNVRRGGSNRRCWKFHLTAREITRREYDSFLRDPFVGLRSCTRKPINPAVTPIDPRIGTPRCLNPTCRWSTSTGGRPMPSRPGRAADCPRPRSGKLPRPGQGRRVYPWGNDWRAAVQRGPSGTRCKDACVLLGQDDYDATPDGLFAMGGNVSEWTRSVIRCFRQVFGGRQGRQLPVAHRRNRAHGLQQPPLAEPSLAGTLGFRVAFDRPR